MGILYIVHRMNPDAVASIRSEHERDADIKWASAVELFKRRGLLQPPDGGASSWDEYQEMFEFERWNLLLTLGASEASWDLDKSLDRPGDGLPGIARALPELASIKVPHGTSVCWGEARLSLRGKRTTICGTTGSASWTLFSRQADATTGSASR